LDRKHRIFWKAVGSGLLGIGIFVSLLFLAAMIIPKPEHPDVPDGFLAGFLMIADVAVAMFLSGAIAMFLTFKDISSWKYGLAVPFFSGMVASIPALLIAILFALFSLGLFFISLFVIFLCLIIAELGGISVYVILSAVTAFKKKFVWSQE
jgi:hypothetical protein